MGQKLKDRGPCVYCGKPATSDDHIPPKTIFGDKKPSDLITVPACENCNTGCSLHDEYFRQICLMSGIDGNKAADDAMASFFRSIGREQAKGLRQGFYDRVSPLTVVSNDGSNVGDVTGCQLEWRRMEPVLERIVLGLFWKHADRRLPEGYGVEWKMMPRPMVNVGAVPLNYLTTFLLMESCPIKTVGDGSVFQYRYLTDPTDPNMMTFRLDVYRTVGFMGFTGRQFPGGIMSIYHPRQDTISPAATNSLLKPANG